MHEYQGIIGIEIASIFYLRKYIQEMREIENKALVLTFETDYSQCQNLCPTVITQRDLVFNNPRILQIKFNNYRN